MLRSILILPAFCSAFALLAQGPVPRKLNKAAVDFVSDAPLERITAATSEATGLLDPAQRTFVVRIPIRSFQGFNSPLQREHFIENYMEADEYPNAIFQGRLIEVIDLDKPGEHVVRAKGSFTVHGITQERIIECKVVVTPKGIRTTSKFPVTMADHDIRIPRVVQQKLSPVVEVQVDLLFSAAAG
ncbi:MAG TPA: YceI family protein [Flavobacteriales bacterium]